MSNLFFSPVFYGIQDVATVDGRGLRILYPTAENYVFDAPILDGSYPLVLFAHGSRRGSPVQEKLCPEDESQDYKRWTSVLHLLARHGFVVVAPDIHRELPSAMKPIEDTVRWMRREWEHRQVLHRQSVFIDPDRYRARSEKSEELPRLAIGGLGEGFTWGQEEAILGVPTPLGLIGHSWGAKSGAKVAADANIRVDAFASVAGTFDDNDVIIALEKIRTTLLVAGHLDSMQASVLPPLWHQMMAPKGQILIKGADHWSWFSPDSGLHDCDHGDRDDVCPVAWRILSEALLTFMAKHLMNYWFLPPYLIGAAGGPPPLPFQEMWTDERCSFKVRWEDALSEPPSGSHTYGFWSQDW